MDLILLSSRRAWYHSVSRVSNAVSAKTIEVASAASSMRAAAASYATLRIFHIERIWRFDHQECFLRLSRIGEYMIGGSL